ncbi:MAG: hypothetical protein LBU15_03945 [Rickettsiales bacterium]|jgi:hypothetical protein|nr:hypothetical protein [Rickettsiales bacterium]
MEVSLEIVGKPKFLDERGPGGNPRCIVNIRDSYGAGGSYEGEYILQDDKIVLSGKGNCNFAKGGSYEGDFRDNKFNGWGRRVFASGEQYEGNFKDGKFEGLGKYVHVNGDFYEGYFEDGKFEGWGKYVLTKGGFYEGNFKDNKFNGWGRREFANCNFYEGYFEDGKFEGWGRQIFPNGNFYEGYFKDGKFEGLGKYVFLKGSPHEGNFKDGKFENLGKYVFLKGSPYEGNFKDDKFNGWRRLELEPGSFYEGYFRDDKYDGWGKLILPNGELYVGEFKNGKFNGLGMYVLANGDFYEGYLKGGKFNGSGRYVFANGARETGFWLNGKRDGIIKYLNKRGKSYEDLYHQDRMESKSHMSAKSYEDSEITEVGADENGKPLWTTKFAYDSGGDGRRSSLYTDYHIYDSAGKLERTIRINFNRLNELANSEIANLDRLVAGGAILDVTGGLENSKKISTFGAAKKYLGRAVVQHMKDLKQLKVGVLDAGGENEIINLIQLANIDTLEQLNRTRFIDPGWNKARLESIYSNLETFLGALGINASNLKNIRTDFIALSVSTTSLNHEVGTIINIKKIKELVIQQNRKLSSIDENVIVCFDSSRVVGCPKVELNIGGITKNCRFVNQNLQEHGVCWLYATVATLVASRDPDLVGRLLAGRIESYGLGDGVERPGLLNEYERKVLQFFQDIAAGAGMAMTSWQNLFSREVVVYGVRCELKVFLEDKKLIEALEKRARDALKRAEKEYGVEFGGKFKANFLGQYKRKLSKEIWPLNRDRRVFEPKEAMNSADQEHILALERIAKFQELEIRMEEFLKKIEPKVLTLKKNRLLNLISRFFSIFNGGQIVLRRSTNGSDGKYASGAKDSPEQLTAKLAQSSGNLETATKALDHSYGENLSPSPGGIL